MRRAEILRFYKGFLGFGIFRGAGGVTRSQTKRDTKLRTTRMMFSFAAGERYKLRCNGTTAKLLYRMGAKKAMVFFLRLLVACQLCVDAFLLRVGACVPRERTRSFVLVTARVKALGVIV